MNELLASPINGERYVKNQTIETNVTFDTAVGVLKISCQIGIAWFDVVKLVGNFYIA